MGWALPTMSLSKDLDGVRFPSTSGRMLVGSAHPTRVGAASRTRSERFSRHVGKLGRDLAQRLDLDTTRASELVLQIGDVLRRFVSGGEIVRVSAALPLEMRAIAISLFYAAGTHRWHGASEVDVHGVLGAISPG